MCSASVNRPAPRVVLLTGRPGVGKTTAIRTIAGELGELPCAGFYTEEIREAGRRQGFRVKAFGGNEDVFAHVDFPKHCQVGRYGVDLGRFEAVAIPALEPEPATTICLVDEIGKMECFSERFVTSMSRLLASDKIVIATIALRGGGFIAEVKRRDDVVLRELGRENRDELPHRIAAWLRREK